MSRYKYTCPDVVRYRRNQYRLMIWSNVASVVWMAALWGGLNALAKKNEEAITIPTETQE